MTQKGVGRNFVFLIFSGDYKCLTTSVPVRVKAADRQTEIVRQTDDYPFSLCSDLNILPLRVIVPAWTPPANGEGCDRQFTIHHLR